ncbi:permease-like cell division protein FtsX [Nonomuraea sp. NPDC002799]
MNSPVEDRLREALAEAGATIDTGTLRPLRAPEHRRFRVDLRLVAIAVVVILAGAATAVGLGGPGDEDRVVAANPELAQSGDADVTVFLCSSMPEPPCSGRKATAEEIGQIEGKARQLPEVEKMFFVDQFTAYNNFRRDFAHNKSLLDEVKITEMPESFRLKLKEGADRDRVRDAFRGMPGLSSVTYASADAADLSSRPEANVSVFLCNRGSAMVSCGAHRTPDGKGGFKLTKMGKAVTQAEKFALQKRIEGLPGLESAFFESQAEAYKNFKREYASNKALVDATRVEDMPESFRLTLRSERDGSQAAKKLNRQPGVSSVIYAGCVADQAVLADDYAMVLPKGKVCAAAR